MGCKISKLPQDLVETLAQQKKELENISQAFQPMEEEVKMALQKKKEIFQRAREIEIWKSESEKKIAGLEILLKQMQSHSEENSDDFLDINSVEVQIEGQYDEITKIISELKALY